MEIINIAKKLEIYGISTITDNQSEQDKSSAKIPTLWREFMGKIYDGKSKIYAVYNEYENYYKGKYKICLGTQNAGVNLTQTEIFPGTYMVFSKFGAPEQTSPALWIEIWRFFEHSRTKREYKSDFELYDEGGVKIYIGIKGTK